MRPPQGFLSQSQALSGTNCVEICPWSGGTQPCPGPLSLTPSLPTVSISPLDCSPLLFKVLQESFCFNAFHGWGFLPRSLPLNAVHFLASVLMLWLSKHLATTGHGQHAHTSYTPGTLTRHAVPFGPFKRHVPPVL